MTSTLKVMGDTWMCQTDRCGSLFDELAGCSSVHHHRFGVIAQEEGYYVDIKNNVTSINPLSFAGLFDEDALFKGRSFLDSALEHGILEQLQVDRPAASTVKILSEANNNGDKIYLMDSSNVAQLTAGLLHDYSAQDLAAFNTNAGEGELFLLPEGGMVSVLEWQGKGYVGYNPETPDGWTTMQMTIGGDYDLSGGYGGYKADIDPSAVATNFDPNWFQVVEVPHPVSAEPVDLATGAYLYDSTDLALGQGEPRGIQFSRSYSSFNVGTETPLGPGWDHNWNAFASVYSDGNFGLGGRRAVDASPMIVAAYAVLDLGRLSTESAKDWLLKGMASKWAVDRINDNSVAIHVNGQVLVYCEQPDGSFTAPPGVTSDLVSVAGGYELRGRFGTVQHFTEDQEGNVVLTDWTDVDGKTLTVSYEVQAGSKVVDRVTDCYGRWLQFGYEDGLLSGLTDSTGRSVSFGHDGEGDLTSFTGPDGNVSSFHYDGRHRITDLWDPDGRIITGNSYNGLDQVWRQMSEGTNEWLFFFSGFRNVERDPQGGEKVYLFNEEGLASGMIDAVGNSTFTIYNGQNKPAKRTNPRGYATEYGYDQFQNVVTVTRQTDDDPLVTRFGFDTE
ncbi:MAG: RHS repeat protein, partial [Verrucomicrobiae bacterium]|nr:RHS repeat protein [Verrucomicrobiae bacterium]